MDDNVAYLDCDNFDEDSSAARSDGSDNILGEKTFGKYESDDEDEDEQPRASKAS